MTRAEHLQWCKERALEYVAAGELENAVTSMLSDLSKHPETEESSYPAFVMLVLPELQQRDPVGVRKWIEGFN